MPRYFYKDIWDKTWNYLVKKTILVASQIYRLHSTLYWYFHWIKVRNMDVYRVKPKWNFGDENQIWKPKLKIQKLM